LPTLEVEETTVFLRNVFRLDESGKRREYIFVRKDKDLGCGNWIEPFLGPTPDSRKERRCTDDLANGN